MDKIDIAFRSHDKIIFEDDRRISISLVGKPLDLELYDGYNDFYVRFNRQDLNIILDIFKYIEEFHIKQIHFDAEDIYAKTGIYLENINGNYFRIERAELMVKFLQEFVETPLVDINIRDITREELLKMSTNVLLTIASKLASEEYEVA